jgi:two-component system chemotaxis response regulator CheB
MIVDDSTVIRRLLTETLAADSTIEVVGTAANGKIALAKIPQLAPDAITLDMEMPEMDGLTTLVEIRQRYPNLPVIMCSTLTERGASATFDALAKGASDYVTKPSNVGSVTQAMQVVRDELIPKLKAHCGWSVAATAPPPRPRLAIADAVAVTGPRPAKAARIDVVAIGVSTGGPNALAAILPRLPAEFPVPIVIVQHMPPIFTKHLADRLDQACQITVREAETGDVPRPGTALIAPGGKHMLVRRKGTSVYVELNQDPPENFCRPAVDVLFRSVETAYGSHVLAAMLTGMGRDGLIGCEQISRRGGQVIAQDQLSSVVWGMPGAVAEANLADRILPLSEIADEFILRAFHHRRRAILAGETYLRDAALARYVGPRQSSRNPQ